MTRMVLNATRGGCADVTGCRLSAEKKILLSHQKAVEQLRQIVGESFDIKSIHFMYKTKDVDCERSLDAFSSSFANIQYPAYSKASTEKAIDLLDDFLKSIPVYMFECRNEKEYVEALEKALEENNDFSL